MTPQQIRDAIAASPELQALGSEHGAIAAALSVGRTKIKPTEIGKGTIVEILGLATGNAFLDAIDNTADFRHVKHLLTEGRLRVDSNMVASLLAGFVQATLLTQNQADALHNLAKEPDYVSVSQVIDAMKGA